MQDHLETGPHGTRFQYDLCATTFNGRFKPLRYLNTKIASIIRMLDFTEMRVLPSLPQEHLILVNNNTQ